MTALAEPVQDTLFDIDEPSLDSLHPIEFVATPLWLLRIGTIDGNAKYVFTALLSMYGDPDDGKRLRVTFPPVSQEQLAAFLRLSPHLIKRCITDLQEAHNCPRCRHRHALVRAERLGRSESFRYRVVKCDSIEELLPLEPPAPKRAVVLPMQWRAKRDRGEEAPDATASEGDVPAEATTIFAPAATDPKIGILREIQRYHKRQVSPGVLEAIAASCFDGAAIATRLETALDLVYARRNLEHRVVTPTFAVAVLDEARRAPAGHDPENFTNTAPRGDRDQWELDMVLELFNIGGKRASLAEQREVLEKIRTLIVAHRGLDAVVLSQETARLLTDPRFRGNHGFSTPKNPVGLLLSMLASGKAFVDAFDDDKSEQCAVAFKRDLRQEQQRRAIEIAKAAILDGTSLDSADARAALARIRITGRPMKAYITRLAREELAAG
jgi:uncharacterized membrane protein